MTKSYSLRTSAKGTKKSEGTSELGFEFDQLEDGQSCGVDQVVLNCGSKRIVVLPTRGMGIWRATNSGTRFGWDSPVHGPIHPMWVPISEPSGLGWLSGFDEMMVRCGLESNGAPDFSENGQLALPLHGRIANLPASDVSVEIDEAQGRISVRGTVRETRFHFHRLQMQTEISIQMDSDEITIVDRVTNLSKRPTTIQMLYHNNFGPPILESGSQFFAPIKKLVPRNEHSATGIETWNYYQGPESGYSEQVYFMELNADQDNKTLVLLTNSDRSVGTSIRYDITELPCFTLWKNTVAEADGYVTGLEPGTNFPNPKSFEESQGRVVKLASGEGHTMSLKIGMLVGAENVKRASDQIETLSVKDPQVMPQPTPDWCSP